MRKTRFAASLAAVVTVGLALSACSTPAEPKESTPETGELFVQELHDQLPERIRESGELKIVTLGAQPPWFLPGDGADEYTGAGPDLADVLGEVLGLEVTYGTNSDIAAAITAVTSGRYDIGFGPFGDTTGGDAPVDPRGVTYIDFVEEFVPFLVAQGNPKDVGSLETLCGITAGAQANGGAYVRLTQQAEVCAANGEDELVVVGLDGVPDGVLAVESGRIDAFFSSGAPLVYYAQNSDGALELAGTDSDNGFSNLFQGNIVASDSGLEEALLSAWQKLYDEGVYAEIMAAHGLQQQMLEAPAINYAAIVAGNG